jgi:hypothetical protein
MTTLNSERNWLGFHQFNAAKRLRLFPIVSFDNLFRLRMLDLAVDFTKPASHAVLFKDKDSSHHMLPLKF